MPAQKFINPFKSKYFMIKAIIFDVGKCYLQGSFIDFVNRSYKVLGINKTFTSDQEIVFDSNLNRGIVSVEECFTKYFQVPISNEKMEEIKKIWTSTWVATDEMLHIVKKLKKEGYILAILSNSDLLNSQNYTKKGWYSYFDFLILSHEIGIIKPERKIYELTLKKLNLPAKECIFIDDQKKLLIPAKEMGMKTIHFTSAENLKKELIDNNIKI